MDNPMIDAYEYCMLSKAREQIEQLQQRLDEAEKVIGFYAKNDYSASHIHHYSKLPHDDLEEFKEPFWHLMGGKRAREYQAKYGERK